MQTMFARWWWWLSHPEDTVTFSWLRRSIVLVIFTLFGWNCRVPIVESFHPTVIQVRHRTWTSGNVVFPNQCQFQTTTQLYAEADDSSSTNDDRSVSLSSYNNKDLYQRVFYRFTPGSDVDQHQAVVIEERCRFIADPDRPDYVIPVGQRTLILRDGRVEDGEIGDDFFITTGTTSSSSSDIQTHNGAGNDLDLQATLVTAMYLACNPKLCQNEMLEIACDTGLASLLGCIGAAFVQAENDPTKEHSNNRNDIMEDILTISKADSGLLPKELDLLVLSDTDEDHILVALNNAKYLGVATPKIATEILDWRVRKIRPRGTSGTAPYRREFRTIVASDVAFSYPEAKELARTVAHRLQPNMMAPRSSPLPTFLYICPEQRDEVPYLRKLLEQGYRMTTQSHYVKLEKLLFHFQALTSGQPEEALDDLELELREVKEINFHGMTAQHHPDFVGGGSGELFFPIETGEYEVMGASTFLEKESGIDPW